MPTTNSALARLTHGQTGMMLVDLLVAMAIFVVVLGAIVTFLRTSLEVGVREQERASAIGEAEVGLARMVRELRQTRQVFASGTSTMDVEVIIDGQPMRVLYRCDLHPTGKTYLQCVRAASGNLAQSPSPSAGQVVIDRVLNGTPAAASEPGVFTFYPDATNPSFVRVKLVVPASGNLNRGYRRNIVLDDGFYIRNLGQQ